VDDELREVIRGSQAILHEGRYAYLKAASQTNLGDHFLVAQDGDETTVVTAERHVDSLLFEEDVKWFRLIEIRVSLPFLAKGFIAAVTRALADRDLNVLVVSTFSKDYFLVREEGSDEALAALRDLGFPLAAG